MTGRKVTKITPRINVLKSPLQEDEKKRRVAAYARVSTDSDEQFTSYEAQIDYYTQYIKRRDDWEFIKVYADEGITGTNTKHRDGFNQMIKDALAGRFDLIITKSISRFARNTVDTLINVRKLKEHGIEVFFEKENIYTFENSGEIMITIMSSLAQEESRSISENVRWGQQKRFADGKVSLPYKRFLGYKKGKDDLPEIVPEEAKIVHEIYSLFISGLTPISIAKELTRKGIPTPGGKTNWGASTIYSILTNEKYKGDARLQKTFTVDFLTKKVKVNEGEYPQYYVENSHPAIIPPEEWEQVQREIARRRDLKGKYRSSNPLSSRIVCGDCGSYYGSKVWHSTDKYRKVIWQCNTKFKSHCQTPNIDDDTVRECFVTAVNQLSSIKDIVIDECKTMLDTLSDYSEIDNELDIVIQEIEIVTELTDRCIKENASSPQNQTAFQRKYDGLVDRYETAKKKADELTAMKERRQRSADSISAFMFGVRELGLVDTFDIAQWQLMIDKVIVHRDGSLVYRFLNGHEIEIQKPDE